MKLNWKRTFFVGLAFMSICAFWQIYDSVVPLILTDTFELGDAVTGIIMALDNILAVFMLPLFGALSDRTDTRLGKRTPFIIVGTAVAVASMLFIPTADKTHNFLMFFIALGISLVAMGTYRSPAVALMPDLTPKPLRSKANAVINLMGAVGGVYGLVLIKLTVSEPADYTAVYYGVAGLMVVTVVLLVITIREKKLAAEVSASEADEHADAMDSAPEVSGDVKLPKPVLKSLVFLLISVFLWFAAYNAMTTAYSRYVKEVWGQVGGSFAGSAIVGTVAAVISYIPIGFISSYIGRKKMILIGVAVMTAAYAVLFMLTEYNAAVLFIMLILIGFGWAAINVNSYPMVVEMSRGSDIGRYTGLYYTFSMTAQIVTPVLSGLFIQFIGYRTLFPYATAFSALAFVTMIMVRHGDSKPQKKKDLLENLDVDD